MIDREAFIRPSAMGAIDLEDGCSGRPLMEARSCALVPALRDSCSEPARQGTLGHQALAGVLGDAFAGDWSRAAEVIAGIEGRMAGMAYWTKDATRSALAYGMGLIASLANRYARIVVLVEQRLDGSYIDIPAGGSADLVILCYYASGTIARAVVVDWKLGWVCQGEAAEHLQLGCYAAMSWAAWTPPEGVEVHLAMGRRKEFTSALYDRQAIAGVRSRIMASAKAARADAPTLRPCLKGCRYCRALVFCRASRSHIMDANDQLALFGADPADRVQLAEAAAIAKRFVQEADAMAKLWRAQEAEASACASSPN